MANRIKELLEKVSDVANNDGVYFDDDVSQFLFGAGQIMHFLLKKGGQDLLSRYSVEGLLKKTKTEQIQMTIVNMIKAGKLDENKSDIRFERLLVQVLSFESEKPMKNYQRFLLTGYYSPSVFKEEEKLTEVMEITEN